MTNDKLADEIERFTQVGGALISTHEGQPPFRPKGDWVKASDHDKIIAALRRQPDGEMRELERIAKDLDRSRLLSLAADVRDVARKLSAAEAEGRKG